MKLENIDREWMLRGAISMIPRSEKKGIPLWSIVASICCVGSTSACEICRSIGWNPHARAVDALPSVKAYTPVA